MCSVWNIILLWVCFVNNLKPTLTYQTTNGSNQASQEMLIERLVSARVAVNEQKLMKQLELLELDSLQQTKKVLLEGTQLCSDRINKFEQTLEKLNDRVMELENESHLQKQLIDKLNEVNQQQDGKIQELSSKLQTTAIQKTHSEDSYHGNITRVGRSASVFAFSAYLTYKIPSLASGTVLKFDGIVLNEGNDYNTHTGIYTVPASGIYVFHYSIEWIQEEIVDVCLMLNGKQLNGAVVQPVGIHGVMGTNSVVLRASRGDRVWIENLYGVGAFYGHEDFRLTTFSGYLLY